MLVPVVALAGPSGVRAREPDAQSCGIPYELIERILNAVPNVGQPVKGKPRDSASKTKARLAVIAYTGLPHASLKRLRPQDVLWDARAMVLPGRQKGRGTRPKTVPLTYDGLKAMQRFDELECCGNFNSASMWSSFQRACKSLGNQGLATPRPAAQFLDGAVRRHRGRPGNAAASRTHLTAHDGSLHPGGHSRPPERRHYDPRRQARSVATCGRFTWQKRGSTPWQYGRDRVSPVFLWSGRRGSNPRPTAWEAVTLPLSYSRSLVGSTRYSSKLRSGDATQGLL